MCFQFNDIFGAHFEPNLSKFKLMVLDIFGIIDIFDQKIHYQVYFNKATHIFGIQQDNRYKKFSLSNL